MVTDATKKLREPVAYILLAFAGLVALASLLQLFVGGAGFTASASGVRKHPHPARGVRTAARRGALAVAVWLVAEAGERTQNARTVALAALIDHRPDRADRPGHGLRRVRFVEHRRPEDRRLPGRPRWAGPVRRLRLLHPQHLPDAARPGARPEAGPAGPVRRRARARASTAASTALRAVSRATSTAASRASSTAPTATSTTRARARRQYGQYGAGAAPVRPRVRPAATRRLSTATSSGRRSSSVEAPKRAAAVARR